MISELSLGNMTKQLHDIKKYFSTVGVVREKSSKELLQKLGYESLALLFANRKKYIYSLVFLLQ